MKKTGIGAGIALMSALAVTAVVVDDVRGAAQAQQTQPQQTERQQTEQTERREVRKIAEERANEPQGQAHAHQAAAKTTRSVTVLFPIADSGVSGLLTIEQLDERRVLISGTVRGLEPNTKHGFHIHEFGDLSDLKEGQSVGGHFAPEGTPHGRQEDPAEKRHVGDLGNIDADDNGVARVRIEDELVSLQGANSVIGRAFVVHAEEDKFTQPSGDAGGRIAFGTIGVAKPDGRTAAGQPSPPAK